jgi:hypothetical protein
MNELVDFSKELERLEKELAAANKDKEFCESKLNNPSFVDKAPEKVVAAQRETLAKANDKIALLEANTYNDQKMLEVYRYFDGKISEINQRLAGQDVRNQGYVDAFRELAKDIDYKVNLEAERRECADNKIVCYANGTFATKLINDYTAGTTTTAMTTFNPLCCCGQGK